MPVTQAVSLGPCISLGANRGAQWDNWGGLIRKKLVEYAAMGCSTKALIGAFLHTTRKEVRSIYHIYVARIRVCIYVYFIHLFFNPSDLPSIYLIRSGDDLSQNLFSSTVGFLRPSLQRKRTIEKLSEKNGDIYEQHKVRGWSMLLWGALPRHPR